MVIDPDWGSVDGDERPARVPAGDEMGTFAEKVRHQPE
jgi:hypothetical protein